MKSTTEEKPQDEKRDEALIQIRSLAPKDISQNIPKDESSEEETDSSSVEKQLQPEKLKELSTEELSSEEVESSEIKSDSSGDEMSEKSATSFQKSVQIAVHQEVADALKAPPPRKVEIAKAEQKDSIPYRRLEHSTSVDSSKKVEPDAAVITNKPVVATAAITAVLSAFSPIGRRDDGNYGSEPSEEEKNVKQHKKRSQMLYNEDTMYVPLHGSSDEEEMPGEVTKSVPSHTSLYEQSVVDEGDGLVQSLPPSPSNNIHSNEIEQVETQIVTGEQPASNKKRLLLKLPSESAMVSSDDSVDRQRTDSAISEIQELQTIQRIYGDTANKPKPKKKKRRMFLKVPNEDAVIIPLYGSSDEDQSTSCMDNAGGNLEQDSEEETAPNDYGIIVPLQGDPSISEGTPEEEPVLTTQPVVATAAFTALFGAFSPLAESQKNSDNTENEPEKIKTTVKKKKRIFKKVPNENAVYIPLHGSTDEEGDAINEVTEDDQITEEPHEYAIFVPLNDQNNEHPGETDSQRTVEAPLDQSTAATSAPSSHISDFPPIQKEESRENISEKTKEIKKEEESKEHQILKEEPSKNAESIRSSESVKEEHSEEPKAASIPPHENNNGKVGRGLETKVNGNIQQGVKSDKEFAENHPAVATAAFTSLFSAFSPLVGFEDAGRTKEQTEEEKSEPQPANRKQRIFKKVPNENAVFIPLHSSEEEEIQEEVQESEEAKHLEEPNEYKVLIPLHDSDDQEHANDTNQKKIEENMKQPTLATAAFTALFSAFSPLGGHETSDTQQNEDAVASTKDEDFIEEKPKIRKRRMFKKVPNQNAVYVPLHSSSEEDLPQNEQMDENGQEAIEKIQESPEEPNKYSIFVSLREDAKNNKQTKEDNFEISNPSVASAAYSALFSVFSPLGVHEIPSAEVSSEDIGEDGAKIEEPKKASQKPKIFKRVPNEKDAFYIPLHGSSEEDIQQHEEDIETNPKNEVEKPDDETKQQNEVEKPNYETKQQNEVEKPDETKQQNEVEKPNDETKQQNEVEKPDETKQQNEVEKHKVQNKDMPVKKRKDKSLVKVSSVDQKDGREGQKKLDNVIISQPSVATVAVTALFSASISPATENDTKEKESLKKVVDTKEVSEDTPGSKYKKETEETEPKEKQNKERDKAEEKSEIKEEAVNKDRRENFTVSKEGSKECEGKKPEEEKMKALGKAEIKKEMNESYHEEDSVKEVTQTTVTTAAFTSLFTAFSPLGEKEQEAEKEYHKEVTEEDIREVNAKICKERTEVGEEKTDVNLENEKPLVLNTEEVNESKVSFPHEDNTGKKDGHENILEKVKESQITKSTIAVAAYSSLFSAIAPLGESEQSKNETETKADAEEKEVEEEIIKKPKKKRIFKKVPNENAVFIPLHSSSEEDQPLGEEEENEEAPNEYAILVPLQDDKNGEKEQQEKAKENKEMDKTTVAAVAFSALFSVFSPLGSAEQLKDEQPEGAEAQASNEEIRKRQDKFKKLSNNAIFIPLTGSTDEEETTVEESQETSNNIEPTSEANKTEDITILDKPVVKSILKTSRSGEFKNENIGENAEKREKVVQIEEPKKGEPEEGEKEEGAGEKELVEENKNEKPKKKKTKISEKKKQTEMSLPEEPKKVKVVETTQPKMVLKMADIVLDVLATKGEPEATSESDRPPSPAKAEETITGDHEYEPIQAPRAASQPDVRALSQDQKLRRDDEERYEVVKPQGAPVLQETIPNLHTEGGYEIIEEPKKELRRCIKIPNEDAIIVPLHGSSDEEINPDRYTNPALMMNEEEIENFPRQPLPFVNIPMQNQPKEQPSQEGTFQEKLKTQADRFTTKLKGISKPKIVIHKPKIKLPDKPNIKMPEMPKFKLPERPRFNLPDTSTFHLPERAKFNLPNRPKFHLPEKPKFLTERPKFKLPERFTRQEKKPKEPKGKKRNPSSLRRPLRDVVTVSSQSTPGSTHNIFETLKFRTYPRFLKKKKAPLQKMSSLETESSQPETPPRRPRRFSDQQQDTSWVHAYKDIRFADEETNLRVERMEEAYEREENMEPFHERYDVDNTVDQDFKHGKADSMTSVVSEKGSSESSSNRRRAGVIEEIDSDEFFVRQKGLSREDVDVSRYLSLEIRDAFRQPKNALASLDNEFYDDDEPKFEHAPRAPVRSKSQKSSSADRAQEIHTFPKRPTRRKESDPEVATKPPRRFRSKSGSRYRQSSMPSLSGEPPPEPPTRKSRERSLRSLNKEGRASDLDIVQTRITAQHSGEIPPVAPLRKSRSRGTSLADDDRTSRGAGSSILPDDDEMQHPPRSAGRDEDILMVDDREVDIEEEIIEDKIQPIQTKDTIEIDDRIIEHSGYAVVTKEKKKPPRPPQPSHHFDFHTQIDNIKTTGKNIFYTYPRRAIKSLQRPLPERPMRYNTIGPVRPPRRRSRVFRAPAYLTGETLIQQEARHEKERDLQSGEVVRRMKVRPLPAPPRPPRKSRDYDVLIGETDETTPTETILVSRQEEVGKEEIEPEVKESRSSYLKAKKDEFLRTFSKYTSFDRKEEEKEQTTTSQQTSFDYGEVSVSIQTDPLPKDVIVIDQEIEETEEILILSDSNGKEYKHEKSDNGSASKTRSPAQEKRLKEEVEKKEVEGAAETNIFQQALERVEAARGVLKEARERVIPGSTGSLDERRNESESVPRHSLRESLPASPRSEGLEKEGTPPPLPARPSYTKPIPVSFPDKLHLSELDVEKLNVSEIQANKIKVSEIESTCIDVTELTSRGGNLTLNGIELPPDFISDVVSQVTSQVQSQMSEHVQNLQREIQVQREALAQKETSAQKVVMMQRELTPQRQVTRMVTPPPSIVVQATVDPVALPEPRAPETEVKEHIPQPKTTKSRGRKSPTRVIDDSEDELANLMPRRRDQEKEKRSKGSKKDDPLLSTEDPPVPSPPSTSLGQASTLQLMARLFTLWQGHLVDGAGTFVQGVNSLFPEGEKRRDAQIAAVILLILITGLILIGFGFDHSVHHHHWDYLPPR